ncbi:MAG: serine protease [Actinomycetota bacterium]
MLALVVAAGAGLFFVLGGDSDDGVEATNTTSTTAAPTDTTQPEETTTTVAGPLGAEQLAQSVVQIQLLLDGVPTCTGSGTIVDPDGTVVTNFHVVEQSPFCPHDRIGVAVAESSQMAPTLSYEADLLAFDIELDLAVVKIARSLDGDPITEQFTPLTVGDSDDVSLGDEIRVIGFPGIGGDTVTFTTGSVSGFTNTPEGDQRSWIKTDATITGGNSGGLAADTDGNFIGVPTRVGTGDGQIVDCRVITDSNGDGRLDGDDSCVPIGGFINGIRPVALAVPLIEESRTAAPIDQGPPPREEPMARELPEASNPTWASGVTEEGVAIDSLTTGIAGQLELCVTWDYANVPVGMLTDAIWLIDGETIPEASVFGAENVGDTFGSFFACITNDAGLEPGVYELAWVIEDELVFAEAIIVGSGDIATIDVENATDEPLCVVQFNPTGTATYGLNELFGEIQPGEVVTFEVAIGPLDARIIDCDGSIRIEDASGFEVEGDLIVTVD